jgi:hypothetical protein
MRTRADRYLCFLAVACPVAAVLVASYEPSEDEPGARERVAEEIFGAPGPADCLIDGLLDEGMSDDRVEELLGAGVDAPVPLDAERELLDTGAKRCVGAVRVGGDSTDEPPGSPSSDALAGSNESSVESAAPIRYTETAEGGVELPEQPIVVVRLDPELPLIVASTP